MEKIVMKVGLGKNAKRKLDAANKMAKKAAKKKQTETEIGTGRICGSCLVPKEQPEFPDTEWNRYTYTGRDGLGNFVGVCAICFVKAQRRACAQCAKRKDKTDYSVNQWKKWGADFEGICKVCTTENSMSEKAIKEARKAAALSANLPVTSQPEEGSGPQEGSPEADNESTRNSSKPTTTSRGEHAFGHQAMGSVHMSEADGNENGVEGKPEGGQVEVKPEAAPKESEESESSSEDSSEDGEASEEGEIVEIEADKHGRHPTMCEADRHSSHSQHYAGRARDRPQVQPQSQRPPERGPHDRRPAQDERRDSNRDRDREGDRHGDWNRGATREDRREPAGTHRDTHRDTRRGAHEDLNDRRRRDDRGMDRGRDDGGQGYRGRDERPHERAWGEPGRNGREREDRGREDRGREDRGREDRGREDRGRDDRGRDGSDTRERDNSDNRGRDNSDNRGRRDENRKGENRREHRKSDPMRDDRLQHH